jgi:hypothetical protein
MRITSLLVVPVLAALSMSAQATGLATCDSGPKEGWQVRRIKVDGGCYEVYAVDPKGARVEAYFHPVTLEPVPTKR